MIRLSAQLQSIYDLEIELGNEVARIDEPAGSTCPYAIVFVKPLHLKEIEERIRLPASVEFWECRDTHYPIENGYKCAVTSHTISVPITS